MIRLLSCLVVSAVCLFAAEPWTAYPLGSTDAPYGYLEHLPPGHPTGASTTKIRHPLILFLHGSGELGDSASELAKVAMYGPLKLLADKDPLGTLIDEQGAVVVAPQGLKADKWWRTEKLIATLDDVLKRHPDTDLARIYVTGLSMGGGGTWALATAIPERLAAVVPICGAAGPNHVDRLKGLPIWANHAIGDPKVPFAKNTQAWFEALLTDHRALPEGGLMAGHGVVDKPLTGWLAAKGGWQWIDGIAPANDGMAAKLVLTIYPGNRHDSWTRTYQDKAMWEWMFAQVRAKKR